jgi:F-type H+-transporting ATPase subunit gamma
MSERLADLDARIGTVRQLDAVITAMRGMAAARAREARGRLEGIRSCAATIGEAIGEALLLAQPERRIAGDDTGQAHHDGATRPRVGRHLVLACCSEQGFAGTFNERILERVAAHVHAYAAECMVLGERGVMAAAEWGLSPVWSTPMVSHADDVTALANRVAQALMDRLDAIGAERVTLIYAMPTISLKNEVVEHTLLPFDFTRFALSSRGMPPLATLSPQRLLVRLAEEYVFAQLCEAVMLSFAAENEARMQAMVAARANVRAKLDELVRSARRVRQEQITAEIIELSAGVRSNRSGR